MMSDRDICSMCLEPFEERSSKILPCLHVFCLTCLEELAQHAASKPEMTVQSSEDCCSGELNSIAREATQPVTFPCPTCRALTTVPVGGVVQFQQSSVSTGEGKHKQTPADISCDLCDGKQERMYSCIDCHMAFCSSCDQFHHKLTSGHHVERLHPEEQTPDEDDDFNVIKEKASKQAMVIENALAQLWEDEKKIEEERKLMSDKIKARYSTLVMYANDAREKSERELDLVTKATREKVEGYKSKARQILSNLWKLNQPGWMPGSREKMKTALISEEELKYYKLIASCKDKQVNSFTHQTDDDAVNPGSVKAFIGSVIPLELTGDNLTTMSTSAIDSEAVRDDQSSENRAQETVHKADATEYLADDCTATLSDPISESQKSTLPQEEIISKILEDRELLQSGISDLCQALLASKECLQNNTDMIAPRKCEYGPINTIHTHYGFVTEVHRGHIMFRASAKRNSFRHGSNISFSKMLTNTGGGYDPKTGIFTAPVTGIYLFVANVVCNNAIGEAELNICLDGCSISFSYPTFEKRNHKEISRAAAHALVSVTVGQKVSLIFYPCRYESRDKSACFEDDFSHFTGMIICDNKCSLIS